MPSNNYTTDDVGFSQTLVRDPIFNPISELYSQLKNAPAAFATFQKTISPQYLGSGGFGGNFNVVDGYLKSSNYQTGVNGWKIDAIGNAEFNSATVRGSLFADNGLIGQWVIDSRGIYYNGTGNPYIKTAANVGLGYSGVIIDGAGIRGYDATLGEVFNLFSDGSAPEFSFGKISESIFEINTNAVLRTSEEVGDGSASSAGVLINNTGIYATGANQLLTEANVKILANGDAYFKGTINASEILSSTLESAIINSSIVTGGLFRTAVSGQRIEINSLGMVLYSGDTGAAYGDNAYLYNDPLRPYGTGVLAYINNSEKVVPIYMNAEQSVADIHLYPRSGNPVGPAEEGDLVSVGRTLRYCKKGGTPGDWMILTGYTTSSSSSSSSSSTVSTSSSSSSSSTS